VIAYVDALIARVKEEAYPPDSSVRLQTGIRQFPALPVQSRWEAALTARVLLRVAACIPGQPGAIRQLVLPAMQHPLSLYALDDLLSRLASKSRQAVQPGQPELHGLPAVLQIQTILYYVEMEQDQIFGFRGPE
jgi:hypothetical protein